MAAVAIVIVLLSFVRRAGGVGGKIYLHKLQTVNSWLTHDPLLDRVHDWHSFMASLLPELTAFFFTWTIHRQKLRAACSRMVTTRLQIGSVGGFLLENRFSPSASLYLLGSLLSSCHYRPKQREAMLKRRKLKGVRCAETWKGKIPAATNSYQPLRETYSPQKKKLCGFCSLYIYLYIYYCIDVIDLLQLVMMWIYYYICILLLVSLR